MSCQIAMVDQPLGLDPVSATFVGDNYYLGSSDNSQQRLVFSYLRRGRLRPGRSGRAQRHARTRSPGGAVSGPS